MSSASRRQTIRSIEALKGLGFSHVSARPRAYKHDPEAIEAFKKYFHARVEEIRSSPGHAGRGVVSGSDAGRAEGRQAHLSLGQKGIAAAYLFGAVCPELGTGAALVLPFCNSEAMQLHLDEIATKVGSGALAIVIRSGRMARMELNAQCRLEHSHRPALEAHVNRAPRLGLHRSINLRFGIPHCMCSLKYKLISIYRYSLR